MRRPEPLFARVRLLCGSQREFCADRLHELIKIVHDFLTETVEDVTSSWGQAGVAFEGTQDDGCQRSVDALE